MRTVEKKVRPEYFEAIHAGKKTFELFRRDSRNVEIITYDELYDRARFIVQGSENSNDDFLPDNILDDLPF